MNFVVMGAALFVGAVIEDVVPALALPGHAEAPVLLSLVLYYALGRSMALMLVTAIVGGFLSDSLGSLPLGASVVSFCLIGAAARRFHDVVFSGKWVTSMLFGFVAGLAYTLMLFVLLVCVEPDMREIPFLWIAAKAAGTAVLGALAAPLVFGLMQELDVKMGNVPAAVSQ